MTGARSAQWLRRHVAVLLLAGFGIVVVAGVAAAFWTIGVTSPSQGSAMGAQLTQPTSPNASVNANGSVKVTWTQPVGELTGATYSVTRTGGLEGSTVVCANTAGTTCTDNGPLTPAALYTYKIVATLGTNWVSTAATATATAETPSFTIGLSAGPYTAGTPITVTSITAQDAGVPDVTYGASSGTVKTINWSGLANSPLGSVPTYPASSVTFTSGVATPGSFTSFDAGSNTLNATDNGVPTVTGSTTFNVVANSYAQLVLSTPTSPQTAGSSFAETVTATDAYGNPVSTESGTQNVAWASGSGFPANSPGGTTPLYPTTLNFNTTDLGVANSEASTTVTLYNAQSSIALKATVASKSGTSGSFNVVAAAANKLVFTPAGPSTQTASSSAGTSAFTLQVQDSFGNAVTNSGTAATVTLSSTSTGTKFFTTTSGGSSASSVSIANGASSTPSFYYADTKAGPWTLNGTATVNGNAISAGSSPNNTITITAAAVSASVSTVTASPTSIPADGATTSTITVTLTDSYGNPVSGKTVTLTAGSGSSTVTTVNGTTSASGQTTFTIKDSTAQAVIYTAKDTTDNVTVTQTATVTFTPVSGAGTMSVSPTLVTAGSTNNSLVFTFTNNTGSAFGSGSAVAVQVPAGWTAPTATNTSATAGTCTPGALSFSGSGPWTITAPMACGAGTSFTVTYGTSGHTITAPSNTAGAATFTTQTQEGSGGTLTAIGSSPTVTITATLTSCGTNAITLLANSTVNYTLIGAGGGSGGGTGGTGGNGAEITGTLNNTNATSVNLSIQVGCAGGTGVNGTSGGGSAGPGYGSGGSGGNGQNTGSPSGGGGGGTTSIQITSGTSTYIVVAGGGGGGGGGSGTGSSSTGTSTSVTAATGGNGTSGSGSSKDGGGGGGGGVGTASLGGGIQAGGGAGLSYITGTNSDGVTVTANAPVSGGNAGASGSALI